MKKIYSLTTILIFFTATLFSQTFYGVTSDDGTYGGGTIFSYDADGGTYTDEYVFKPNPVNDAKVLFTQSPGVYVGVCDRSDLNTIYDDQPGNTIFSYNVSSGRSEMLLELPYQFHAQNSGNPPGDIILFDSELILGIVLLPNDTLGLMRYSLFTNSYEIVAKFSGGYYPADGDSSYMANGCYFSPVDNNTIVFSLRKIRGTSDGSVNDGRDFFVFNPQDNTVNVLLNIPDADSFIPYGPFTKTNDGRLFCPGSKSFLELDVANASYTIHKPFADSYQYNEDGRIAVSTDTSFVCLMEWGSSDYLVEYNFVKDTITDSYMVGERNNINSFVHFGDSIYFSVASGNQYNIFSYKPAGGTAPIVSYALTDPVQGYIKYLIDSKTTTAITAFYSGISEYYPGKKAYVELVRFGGGQPYEQYAEGALPYADLFKASNGKLYGIASSGGRGTFYHGDGVLFEFDPVAKKYMKLVDFTGENGGFGDVDSYRTLYNMSQNNLTEYKASGWIYGTTFTNGIPEHAPGYGTVFVYDVNAMGNNFRKIFDFNDTTDASAGMLPVSGLTPGPDGRLYGVTKKGGIGGTDGHGVLYCIDPVNDNAFENVIKFPDTCKMYPADNLVMADDGKMYGLAEHNSGGYWEHQWAIREYDVEAKTFSNIFVSDLDYHEFNYAGFIYSSGKLYGVVSGSSESAYLFEFDIATKQLVKKVIFTNYSNYANGDRPKGKLILSSKGMLWGMTNEGGSGSHGVIFEYDVTTDTYKKHHDFDGDAGEGHSPLYSALVEVDDASTYVRERPVTGTLNAYPNPAVDLVRFDMGSNDVISVVYSVYDVSGNEMISGKAEISNSFTIDLGGLKSGAYVVKIDTGSKVYTKKILKK